MSEAFVQKTSNKPMVKSLLADKTRYIWASFMVLLYFGINYKLEYATDTYSTFFEEDSWTYSIYQNGRPLQALIFYLIEKLGLSGPKCYYASWLIAVIALIAAVVLLSKTIDRHIGNEKVSVLISFVTLVNPMIIEYFLFVEKGMFMVLILLIVIAVDRTERLFFGGEGKDRKNTVLSVAAILVCLIAAATTYQVSVNAYVVLCLPIIILDTRGFIKKNVFVAVMYGIPMAISVAVARMFSLGRFGSFPGVLQGLVAVGESLSKVIFDDFWHLKKNMMLAFLILAIILIALSIASLKKLSVALGYAYIIAGCVVVSFILYFVTGGSPLSPRTIYSFGMLFGVILTYFAFVQKSFDFSGANGMLVWATLALSALLVICLLLG